MSISSNDFSAVSSVFHTSSDSVLSVVNRCFNWYKRFSMSAHSSFCNSGSALCECEMKIIREQTQSIGNSRHSPPILIHRNIVITDFKRLIFQFIVCLAMLFVVEVFLLLFHSLSVSLTLLFSASLSVYLSLSHSRTSFNISYDYPSVNFKTGNNKNSCVVRVPTVVNGNKRYTFKEPLIINFARHIPYINENILVRISSVENNGKLFLPIFFCFFSLDRRLTFYSF